MDTLVAVLLMRFKWRMRRMHSTTVDWVAVLLMRFLTTEYLQTDKEVISCRSPYEIHKLIEIINVIAKKHELPFSL